MGPFIASIPEELLKNPAVAEYLEYQARYINALRQMIEGDTGSNTGSNTGSSSGSSGNSSSGGSGSNSGGSTGNDTDDTTDETDDDTGDYLPPIDPEPEPTDDYEVPVEPPPTTSGINHSSGGDFDAVCAQFVRVTNGGTVYLPDYPYEGCQVTVEWTSGGQPYVDTRTKYLFGVPGFMPQAIPSLGSSYTYLYLIEQDIWQLL